MSDKTRRVPARLMDMRIVLTHEYFRIDAAIVWDTVNNDLPALDALVESSLD